MKHDSKVYSLNYKNQYCCPSFYSNEKEIIWDLCRRQVETRLKRERETHTLVPPWLRTLSAGNGKGSMSFLWNQQSVRVAAVLLLLLCYANTISFHLHRPRYNGCHARNSWTRICVRVLLSSFFFCCIKSCELLSFHCLNFSNNKVYTL